MKPEKNSRFFTYDLCNEFEHEIIEKCSDNKYVYLTGDLNSRVHTLRDFIRSDSRWNNFFDIEEEIQQQLDKLSIPEKLAVPVERVSVDTRTKLISFLCFKEICKNNLVIPNGRFSSDNNIGYLPFGMNRSLLMSKQQLRLILS